MIRVDFGRALLRWTEFRTLDLDQVEFPRDDNHIVVTGFPRMLVKLRHAFESKANKPSKAFAASLAHKISLLGPNQETGVLSKPDILEMIGSEGLEEVLRLVGDARRRPW